MSIKDDIYRITPEVQAWRHELHRHPQTAYEETFASEFVQKKLDEFRVPYISGLAKTGVIGFIKGKKPGKRIVLRADMDALNITEETGLPYSSVNAGKMHACGHDGHTAMLLGAAKLLSQNPDFDGEVMLVFQPAEEGGGGALRMLEEGLFRDYPPESVWGMHNWPGLPVGQYGMNHGCYMASAYALHIVITGSGSHAAAPHKSADPIPAVGALINALQSVVSRSVDPLSTAVLSLTCINAGTANNVIPDRAEIRGTIRSQDDDIQADMIRRIRQITQSVCSAYGVSGTLQKDTSGYPVLINTPAETDTAYQAAVNVVGEKATDRHHPPSMGAEDFAFMLRKKPGCYIFMGNGRRVKKEVKNCIPRAMILTMPQFIRNCLLAVSDKATSCAPGNIRFFRDGRTFYVSKFGNYAHMQNRLDTLEEKSQGLIPLFEQANSEEMDFLAIYRAELFEYGDRAGQMYYETGITADFYQVSSRKLIGVNKLILKSSQKDLAEKEIRKFAANYFPVRGFVTETRGEGEVARVAAGGSSGFKKGDRILFRNAILKQNRATDNNVMTVSTSVDYSDEVIGYGEIELLGDDFSWVKIESKYRQAVKAGTARNSVQQRLYSKASAEYMQAVTEFPAEAIPLLEQEYQNAVSEKQYQTALAVGVALLSKDQSNAVFANTLGNYARITENRDQAMGLYRHALLTDKKFLRPLYNIAAMSGGFATV
ncbi:hypothetical protein CHS0354_006898 [Potamilus streckersoni]|uniref:Peptidase M20 dimerisation domain-containing protein n=1 Tax=Potamilus streckersoni TaxID=2493646 RepID=A0AAE0TEE2_9BIVA|nr:hypothetical protein CHS0354_006898 [Potamilus streckersoni]